MKKVGHKTLIFLLLTLVFGCTDTSNRLVVTTTPDQEEKTIRKFDFYETPDQAVYLYVTNKNDREFIKKKNVYSMLFKTEDTVYVGKKINLFYSREIDLEPFVLLINNMEDRIEVFNIEGKEMFYIGLKHQIDSLFYEQVVK